MEKKNRAWVFSFLHDSRLKSQNSAAAALWFLSLRACSLISQPQTDITHIVSRFRSSDFRTPSLDHCLSVSGSFQKEICAGRAHLPDTGYWWQLRTQGRGTDHFKSCKLAVGQDMNLSFLGNSPMAVTAHSPHAVPSVFSGDLAQDPPTHGRPQSHVRSTNISQRPTGSRKIA